MSREGGGVVCWPGIICFYYILGACEGKKRGRMLGTILRKLIFFYSIKLILICGWVAASSGKSSSRGLL